MSSTKIDVSIGALTFSGEGEQAWLAEQLDKVLKAAPELAHTKLMIEATPAAAAAGSASGNASETTAFANSLSSYIKEKGGDSNQVDRFLITADWLRRRGDASLATATVSKALMDNHQKRLANPADCLNKNVSKGYCEKVGKGFFITPEGLKKLGHA